MSYPVLEEIINDRPTCTIYARIATGPETYAMLRVEYYDEAVGRRVLQAMIDEELRRKVDRDPKLADLPRWRSHKVVRAAPIDRVRETNEPGFVVDLRIEGDEGKTTIRSVLVPARVFANGKASFGDMLVVYDNVDGGEYVSWSPRAEFVDGYDRCVKNPGEDRPAG